MSKSRRSTAMILALAVAGTAPGAGFAAPMSAPLSDAGRAPVVEVQSRAGAVAAGVGAGIVLGALVGAAAAAPREVIIAPEGPPPPPSVVYVKPSYTVGPGFDDPNIAVESCRRAILRAARQYGATDVRVTGVDNLQPTRHDGVRFRANMTVFYPQGPRSSYVRCRTREGVIVRAEAVN